MDKRSIVQRTLTMPQLAGAEARGLAARLSLGMLE